MRRRKYFPVAVAAAIIVLRSQSVTPFSPYSPSVRASSRRSTSAIFQYGPPGGFPDELKKRKRAAEIQDKIDKFRREGKLSNSSAMRDAAEFMNRESPLKRYEQKVAKRLADGEKARLEEAADEAAAVEELYGKSDDDLVKMAQEKLKRLEREKLEKNIQDIKEKRQLEKDEEKVEILKTGTSGIGGAWSPTAENSTVEEYSPTVGTWGAFPRPKDISAAYGGGKRIGANVYQTEEEKERGEAQDRKTAERLAKYKEASVDLLSLAEKENEEEITAALSQASLAMKRGIYNKATSRLESVTEFCSTNSRLGGNVYLELAMCYEATGKGDLAINIYKSLSSSKVDKIRKDAQRLLFGIEALEFMNFSEGPSKKVTTATIDASALTNMAQYMTDAKVYNTAYVNMDKGSKYYNLLTKNVVRTTREARQILLKADGRGKVERLRVVQALQAMAREFDKAMAEEEEQRRLKNRKVPMINGQPLFEVEESGGPVTTEGGYTLSSAEDMAASIDGEWRMQLMADRKGEGVQYVDAGNAWQRFDMGEGGWKSFSPLAFLKVVEDGTYSFEDEMRVVRRNRVSSDDGISGGFLASLLSGTGSERIAAQQVLSADSEVCITRKYLPTKELMSNDENIKNYFTVWRRAEVGEFSKAS